MPIYKAPVEDVTFLLNDVFQIDRYDNLPGFTDASADVREAILGEAAKLSEEVLQPLNRVGDLEGCKRHDDGSVTTPKGFKEAFKQVAEGGWLGLSVPTEYGGQGLPVTLSQIVNEFQCSANMAFTMYGGLTMGATAALLVHGSPEQKKTYVPKMVAGEWTGTMNLTEPHCGTDLGLMRTKAVRQGDGSFKEVEECKPKYREEPVMDDWCRYTVDRWKKDREEKETGNSLSDTPTWPNPSLRGGNSVGSEREGSRHETYTVKLKEPDGSTESCDLPEARWKGMAVGSRWKGKVGALSGDVDCSALEPAK